MKNHLRQCIERQQLLLSCLDALDKPFALAAELTVQALAQGGKVLACGNGGSAAEAAHLTSELVGRFRQDRPALSAICLPAEMCAITAIGNDYGFDQIFSRQLEAYAKPGDCLILFSTSGNSANALVALESARDRGVTTIAILGGSGGRLAGEASVELVVPSNETARIQEVHQLIIHALCEAIEVGLGYASD